MYGYKNPPRARLPQLLMPVFNRTNDNISKYETDLVPKILVSPAKDGHLYDRIDDRCSNYEIVFNNIEYMLTKMIETKLCELVYFWKLSPKNVQFLCATVLGNHNVCIGFHISKSNTALSLIIRTYIKDHTLIETKTTKIIKI